MYEEKVVNFCLFEGLWVAWSVIFFIFFPLLIIWILRQLSGKKIKYTLGRWIAIWIVSVFILFTPFGAPIVMLFLLPGFLVPFFL